MKNPICGMDLSRANHEHMNSLYIVVWRRDENKEHGYKMDRTIYANTPARAARITNLFLAWLSRAGAELR